MAYDSLFFDLLPKLFPARDMRALFVDNEPLATETAKRNAALQGAYMIFPARTLGMDCGPMSGFNRTTLDAEFFPDGRWRSDFLMNIGYGSELNLYPRMPRLPFKEAYRIS